MSIRQSAVIGSVLGTAVGDALGLPYEGLSRRRARKLLGAPTRYRLLPGWGMVSDDTEHACMTMQALIEAGDDAEEFARRLARRLRLWLLGAPVGIGLATLKACLKLWAGASPANSGVYSAGNGPAMRAAVLGAAIEDRALLKSFVRASTRITHADPKAEYGAQAVALAARLASDKASISAAGFVKELREQLTGDSAEEFLRLLDQMAESVERGETTADFAASLGLERGVSGYIYHTAPAALHAWLSHPHDFSNAVAAVIECGGDADTTAAIVGGILGASSGVEGIPAERLTRLAEWPRTVGWMQDLACRVYQSRVNSRSAAAPRLPAWGLLPRNAVFAAIVMAHGFRRMLPPY